jgi:hypothetical protein
MQMNSSHAFSTNASHAPDRHGAIEQADSLAYLAGITAELARLARVSRLDTLAYLLEMAALEASSLKGDDRH